MAIVKSVAMNTEVYESFQVRAFIFSRHVLQGGIAGSYGSSSILSFLRNRYTVLHVASPIYNHTNSVEGYKAIILSLHDLNFCIYV